MKSEFELVKLFTERMSAGVVCGALIGIERQFRHKAAGLKTMTLVCLGSTLFTTMSYLDPAGDAKRVAAQIVSGIGFLGAGVIMQSNEKVHGLTTAALLWMVAGIGVVIGQGYPMTALVTSVSIVALMSGLSALEGKFWKR